MQLFGKSGRIFCPMISGGGARKLFEDDAGAEARSALQALSRSGSSSRSRRSRRQQAPAAAAIRRGGSGKMVIDIMKAGGLVVAGTDTPNAINLHGELMAYTMAGMSPFDALKAATVNPAKALGLDAGTIEPGKLADLIVIDGDPLANIANTHKVKSVIANGRVYDVADLVARKQ